MEEIGVFSRVIIALLGIAYPIIFSIISRISSDNIGNEVLETFIREPELKAFQYLLYSSLVSLFIWSFDFDPWHSSVAYSADYLMIGLSSILVVVFIKLVNKIFIYSIPSKLADYLIKRIKEYEE